MAETRLTPLDPRHLRYVLANLREWDRREIFANRWDDDIERLGGELCAMTARGDNKGMVVWHGAEPVAAIGAMEFWPGVWSPWCFGTSEFHRAALLLTRTGKQIVRAVRNCGGHRLEVKSLDGHTDAQRWLEISFGATREATHPGYGRGGETFHTYVVR